MSLQQDFADGRIACRAIDGIGRLTLNRPERRNALDQAMWAAIGPAITWLAADGHAAVIILEGAGGQDFCSGADILEFDTVRADAATARAYETMNSEAFRALREAPVPVLALIRGICFGGGLGLAAACDLRLADSTARFAIPAARLGLAYPIDAVPDIVAGLGAQQARHLLLTAREIDSRAALAAGFLLELHPPGHLDGAVLEIARSIVGAAPLSVRASRMAIAAALQGDGGLAAQAAMLGDATFESADYAEGRSAFRERRKPVFTGR
ncbi:enoyl-CoA hydratase/carnithine racemase [Hoeflea marina]|uniref:Enoyl-CoA hydratase/carnithine racemase n=1 Tax=Hoeflea marina TaxID=274592 RepID=A0A317PUR4_9HYPH|nr:enoyl-CoA hydratase-related protein [Hoeflea marina]PWW03996.1 enoyl-CoA hydratase/carnithine racemase [Hoeflea marina]